MKYCSHCAAAVELRVPAGDNRARHVCTRCGSVFYQNPKIVAGCVAEHAGKLLLCRRAIEPRYGLWTLPAGFMENQETAIEAAVRETREEANAGVDIIDLFTLFSLPHADQVYMMFRSRVLDLGEAPGSESLEVGLFDEDQVPWGEIAFATILYTLRFYFSDRRAGRFQLHVGDIVKNGAASSFVARRENPLTHSIPI